MVCDNSPYHPGNDVITDSSDLIYLHLKGKYGYLIIGSIYRPPNSLAYHYDHIVNDFDLISSFNYDLIIMGELNYNCYDKK